MRTFVVGDIHGNDVLFRKALKSVGLKKNDKLILLGDLIDRGPDSKSVLDTLLLLKNNGFDNIITIKGNHEELLLESYYDPVNSSNWILNGGNSTLKSFNVSDVKDIPYKYISLIESFKNYHIENDIIFVHAGLNFDIENPFSDVKSMLWMRDVKKYEKSVYLQNKLLIHGHNPLKRDDILQSINENNNVLGIDNGSFLKGEQYGAITIYNIESKKIFFVK